nr:hypothetical protein BaRGS_027104 [Batillaria attramentaria]
MDRSGLTKMKKSVKALYNTGSMHVNNDALLAENLERLGTLAKTREQEAELSQAFMKFSHVTKELASLMKNLMDGLNNMVLFPLDALVKGDLKGAKGDLKKPFDKAWKDYETKFSKIEKEKKQQAEKAGMIRTEVSGAEIADEMEKERKIFQLQMCEPTHSSASPAGYSLHQLQGNKAHGNEKKGFLLKKSESRMRRTWQRRRCVIREGTMLIYHQDESKDPVKLNLLTCQVKLARVVGNAALNDVMEATLDHRNKPNPTSPMDERRDFIRAKYEQHKYAIITCTDKEDLKQDLKQAVLAKDLMSLLQVYAEGLDLSTTLPDMLKSAIAGKKDLFVHVNIDWDLVSEERFYDCNDLSDDDLDRARRRCKALYDCEADNDDELTFREGEIIIILEEVEEEWWVSIWQSGVTDG